MWAQAIEVHGAPIGILRDCRSVLLLSLVAVDHWEDVLDRCGFAREEMLSLSLLPTRVQMVGAQFLLTVERLLVKRPFQGYRNNMEVR